MVFKVEQEKATKNDFQPKMKIDVLKSTTSVTQNRK